VYPLDTKARLLNVRTYLAGIVDAFLTIQIGTSTAFSGILPTVNTKRQKLLASNTPTFMVPFGQDETFIGRATLLDEIKTTLDGNNRRVLLSGIGGVG
jgi:hypothetical protein